MVGREKAPLMEREYIFLKGEGRRKGDHASKTKRTPPRGGRAQAKKGKEKRSRKKRENPSIMALTCREKSTCRLLPRTTERRKNRKKKKKSGLENRGEGGERKTFHKGLTHREDASTTHPKRRGGDGGSGSGEKGPAIRL